MLLQAQGALFTGTGGSLEIVVKSRNVTLCLIHHLNSPLTHSLLESFFNSNFNDIIYLLSPNPSGFISSIQFLLSGSAMGRSDLGKGVNINLREGDAGFQA